MYCDFFGLKTAPFRVTPDTSLFYAGGEREALLNAIVYAISHGDGMVKVVGEVGSGKTMLTRMLEKQLPDSVTIIYLPNPSLAAKDLVFAIGHELGLELGLEQESNQTKTHTLLAIQNKLLELHASNQRVVVFIDEAQCMPLDTLEELRLLTNLETETDKLLQLVLFGQPELDEHLSHPSVRQIKERIIHNLYLKPFSQAEVAEYLAFRLHKAGYNGSPLFSRSALKALAKYSDGLPRRLSILADKSILAAFAAQLRTVSKAHVRIAYGDNNGRGPSRRTVWPAWLGLAAILLMLCVGLFVLNQKSDVPFISISSANSNAIATHQSGNAEKNTPSSHITDSTTILTTQPDTAKAVAAEPKKELPLQQVHTQLHLPQPKDSLPDTTTLSTPLLNQVLSKTMTWLNNPEDKVYTIQIMSTQAKDISELEEFLRGYEGQPIEEQLFIQPVTKNNQTLYAVTFGGFIRFDAAKKQLEELPEAMKRFSPYIKKISSMRNTSRHQM
jgi:MSHA biogenesis protein MshM